MANIHGVKGRDWTADEIDRAQAMQAAGVHIADIAQALDRTFNSVEGRLRRLKLAPLSERGGVPEPIRSDDKAHLKAVLKANGCGFGWWPPSIMARVHLLERSPPAGRPFWNAA